MGWSRCGGAQRLHNEISATGRESAQLFQTEMPVEEAFRGGKKKKKINKRNIQKMAQMVFTLEC